MRPLKWLLATVALCLSALSAAPASAADLPAAKEGVFVLKDFRFHTGEVLPELRIHYLTLGDPQGVPVLVLHGTTGSARSMLTPAFGGELFGAGQPLDASRYFVVIPDAIGHGQSSKPSDGLRARFPQYDYDDMVEAQYRLVTEGLGIRHLRLVIGNSMGGMHTWIWGVKHPQAMDLLVPMACQPSPMSSRNWIMRRLIIDSIRQDPEWNGGNYTQQPRSARFAAAFYGFAMAGGNQALARQAPTREKADALLDARLNGPFPADANDTLYQWASSGDYDPSGGLERIQAQVLAINAADDERNPPETGLMEREMRRVKRGRYFLIPASPETAGHLTTGNARWYKDRLAEAMKALAP